LAFISKDNGADESKIMSRWNELLPRISWDASRGNVVRMARPLVLVASLIYLIIALSLIFYQLQLHWMIYSP